MIRLLQSFELERQNRLKMELSYSTMLHFVLLLLMVCSSLAMNQRNILGGELEPCSFDPLTGWFRDGYCRYLEIWFWQCPR